jgi:D-alanyl-D-alanine carboxypeptidase
MRRTGIAALALCIALAVSIGGAGASAPTAETLLARLVHTGFIGGVVLERNGARSRVLTAGIAARSPRTPVVAADHFRVGSITKSFVATVVLQLVGEGRLTLDKRLARQVRGILPAASTVTVRQLLQHRSGLFDYLADDRIFAPYDKGNLGYRWSPRALLRIALSHRPDFAPGHG